ncbi:MAG TPA: sigma-70 family RNA polymerase sigma factor [Chitinophagaceae bacterium]|nr:sigma-70 family RNA polymerase sigma factor [Chitinophagaceae bacterium]
MDKQVEDATADETLVKAVLRGHQDAFRLLVERNQNLVIHIVYRMVSLQHDREDICQDIFLKVYDNLAGFRFGSKLSTWIGSIAYNACINFLRKKKIVLADVSGSDEEDGSTHAWMEQPDASPGPDALLMSKEKHELLWQYVDELPTVQQTIVVLFHRQELQLDEIAGIMNMPVGTIKSYLHRARQKLKSKLSQ